MTHPCVGTACALRHREDDAVQDSVTVLFVTLRSKLAEGRRPQPSGIMCRSRQWQRLSSIGRAPNHRPCRRPLVRDRDRTDLIVLWRHDLFGEFPTAVRDLAAGEHISAVLSCRSRLQDPVFDALAWHALARRFAQERDRARMSAIGVAPFGNRARGPAVDLRVGRAQDDGAILRGHGGGLGPSLRQPLRLRGRRGECNTGDTHENRSCLHINVLRDAELKTWECRKGGH
jgi:hypothetical protein